MWSSIPKYCNEAFMNQVGITIPQKLHNNEGLGKAVANYVKATQYKDDTINAITKKTAASTRPLILKSDGTMYCVINTIMVLMQCYMNTKQSNNKEDQDSRNPKSTEWETIQKRYMINCGVDRHINELSTNASEALLGYNVREEICTLFDDVDVAGFKLLVNYLDNQYRQAHNKKTTAGQHVPFSSSVGGKVWLIYWHTRLQSTGKIDLSCCAYATLDESIRRTSSDMPKS